MRGEYLANLACRGIMTIVHRTPGIAAQPRTMKRLAVTLQHTAESVFVLLN